MSTQGTEQKLNTKFGITIIEIFLKTVYNNTVL